jgi:hypothetical protein
MKQKTIKSPCGVWVTLYEVEYDGSVFWFSEEELKDAEARYNAANPPNKTGW